MRRRGFFGVVAGLLAFFSWRKEAKTDPTTGLPIIRLNENGFIDNADEIFKNCSQYHRVNGVSILDDWMFVAHAYLPREYAEQYDFYAAPERGREYMDFYGPVILLRNNPGRIHLFKTPQTLFVKRKWTEICTKAGRGWNEERILDQFQGFVRQ